MNNPQQDHEKINRREFVNNTGKLLALGLIRSDPGIIKYVSENSMMNELNDIKATPDIKIKNVSSDFEREPLGTPYHFKGSAITECWQTVAMLEAESGARSVGLGTQGILWSDSKVFAGHSESGGNALMYAMSCRALQILKGSSFNNPPELLDRLLPEILDYGKKITGNPNLRKTFALNSLVCVDNAAWILYARENNMKNFDEMIPAAYRPGLSYRHEKVASMPSFSVGSNVDKIKAAIDEGYFILKLKTGSSGTQKEMLEKDIAFLSAVHAAIGHYETPYTKSGKIPYYFDANERYDEKDTLSRFLDHAKKIGAFDQIAVIEEPFGERNHMYVGDMGVTIAADESAHAVEDVAMRIEQGYTAMAVKAVAKTLSMTIKITQLAFEKKIPCFCADLTVGPIQVDWNKNVAARLPPFPILTIGLQETNGHQYYKDWDRMMSYHPQPAGSWTQTQKGVYLTDKTFYEQSGGILQSSPHYDALFKDLGK